MLVPVELFGGLVYTTSRSTWQGRSLIDEIRMPRNGLNHTHMGALQLRKHGCHYVQHNKLWAITIGKQFVAMLLACITKGAFKSSKMLSEVKLLALYNLNDRLIYSNKDL